MKSSLIDPKCERCRGKGFRGSFCISCEGCRKCHKLRAPESDLCPHCNLKKAEEAAEIEERSHKRALKRLGKKDKMEALKESPLRGYNPMFDDKRKTGYEA